MVEKVSIFGVIIVVYILGTVIGKIIAKRIKNEKLQWGLEIAFVVIAAVLFINNKLSTEYIGVPIIIGRSVGGLLLGIVFAMQMRNG